jgi:hypothetical protein
MGVSGQPRPCFIPGERTPGTHTTGGWVGPSAGLDTEARGKIRSPLRGIELRSPGRPARSTDTILPELTGLHYYKIAYYYTNMIKLFINVKCLVIDNISLFILTLKKHI